MDCVIGDVEALPFDDNSFDLVLANYMLYQVPDLDRAIAELRRVLRSGGTLLAATNGQGHLRELWQMQEQACIRLGISPRIIGEVMEPLVTYLASMWSVDQMLESATASD